MIQTRAYVQRLLDVGALDGPVGELHTNPRLIPLVEALHHVLAGGTVEVRVLTPGSPEVYRDLQERAASGMAEAIELHRRAPLYVTAVP
jgi:hypothetical protein